MAGVGASGSMLTFSRRLGDKGHIQIAGLCFIVDYGYNSGFCACFRNKTCSLLPLERGSTMQISMTELVQARRVAWLGQLAGACM